MRLSFCSLYLHACAFCIKSALSVSEEEYVEHEINLGSCDRTESLISLSDSADDDDVLNRTCLPGLGFSCAGGEASHSLPLEEPEGGVSGMITAGNLRFGLRLRGDEVEGTKNILVLSVSVESVRVGLGHEELE